MHILHLRLPSGKQSTALLPRSRARSGHHFPGLGSYAWARVIYLNQSSWARPGRADGSRCSRLESIRRSRSEEA